MKAILEVVESFLREFAYAISEPIEYFFHEYPLTALVLVTFSPIWLWCLVRFLYELINELSYQKVRFIRWFESKLEESDKLEESEEHNHE